MRFVSSLRIAALALALAQPAIAQTPCCDIVSIDVRTGVVSAKNASGDPFQFTVADARALKSLRVGQKVYANFSTNQVSLDGRTTCCAITKRPQGGVAARAPVGAKTPTRAPAITAKAVKRTVYDLPEVAYGDPVPAPRNRSGTTATTARFETRRVTAKVRGRDESAEVLHIRGLDGIEKAPGLDEDARKLLKMHVRTLRPGQSTHYVVNPRAAKEWMATHRVPPSVVVPPVPFLPGNSSGSSLSRLADQIQRWQQTHPPGSGGGGGGSDCGNMFESVACVGETVQNVGDGFSDAWEHMWETANDVWKKQTDELANLWDVALDCFADHRLQGPTTPVRFSITPSMPVSLEQPGSKGGATGTVKGTVTLDVPMEADFQASMSFFYIPCLPFVVRPRNLSADGSLTVGQQLTVAVEATGSFKKRFTLPPTGGPQIPVLIIPIVIGGVPVAVLDVSAYIEGEVEVESEGMAKGQFALTNSHRSAFDFTCDGDGCSGNEKGSTAPATSNQSAQIQGQVSVKPGLFTAMQLNLNYNVLGARAGPQPYLLGTASGCAAGSGSQTAGQASSADQNSALTADLDWGVDLRAEALAGGNVVGKSWRGKGIKDRHIWFGDLVQGGSSALQPSVALPPTAIAGQRTDFKVRMPTCYPYTERVQYRITWAGGAAPMSDACSWQAGTGTCWFDPTKDLGFSLTWPNAGTHAVSVVLLRDDHRTFSSPPRAEHDIVVSAGGGGL